MIRKPIVPKEMASVVKEPAGCRAFTVLELLDVGAAGTRLMAMWWLCLKATLRMRLSCKE